MRYDFNIFGFMKMILAGVSNPPSSTQAHEIFLETENKSRQALAFFYKNHTLRDAILPPQQPRASFHPMQANPVSLVYRLPCQLHATGTFPSSRAAASRVNFLQLEGALP